jgi:ArsR family transcriptional regulator
MTASRSIDLIPKSKRPVGQPCCEPLVFPEIGSLDAQRLARLGKALSDPVRVQLVDVLRRHAGEVCVCELVPLFKIGQPALSHHLKKLRESGIIGVERRGLWAYYYVIPEAMNELKAWLSS